MAGPAEPQRFRELFAAPSVEAMHALSPKEFEKFVAYVFRRAGFEVNDVAFKFTKGVDLELFADPTRRKRMGGVEVKRFDVGNLVPAETVQKLMGAPVVRRGQSRAYLVTTSDFNKAARDMADTGGQTYLLNGAQFSRYINYVRGSRYDDSGGPIVLIPPDVFGDQVSVPLKGIRHTKILAIANNKGGVGKTTTARLIARNLAALGKNVLLVDMDAQANLSEAFLGLPSADIPAPHLAGYFSRQYPLSSTARPTNMDNIAIVPAHPHLSLLDTGGAGRPDQELRFFNDVVASFAMPIALRDKPYDWIILDTPPAISLYTRAALATADYVIAPARSRPASLAGIMNMLGTLDTMGALVGAPPRLLGCLVTHWGEDQHSVDTFVRLQELFDNRRSRILETKIPFDVTVEKTQGATHHRAEEAYERVVEEMLSYVDNG